MANDSFNLFVSIFVSFSINGLKENAENWNYHPILRTKVELFLFSVISPRMRNFFFVASSSAVNSDYDQYSNTQGTTGRIMMMMMTMMIKKKKKNIDTLFWPRRFGLDVHNFRIILTSYSASMFVVDVVQDSWARQISYFRTGLSTELEKEAKEIKVMQKQNYNWITFH